MCLRNEAKKQWIMVILTHFFALVFSDHSLETQVSLKLEDEVSEMKGRSTSGKISDSVNVSVPRKSGDNSQIDFHLCKRLLNGAKLVCCQLWNNFA